LLTETSWTCNCLWWWW